MAEQHITFRAAITALDTRKEFHRFLALSSRYTPNSSGAGRCAVNAATTQSGNNTPGGNTTASP